jgi:hypothetical protein
MLNRNVILGLIIIGVLVVMMVTILVNPPF